MRTHAAVLMTVFVSACGVDLPLRDDVTYTCDDDRDCPLELSCAVGIKQCVRDLDTTNPHLTSITATNRETVILVFDEAVDVEQAKLPGIYFIVRDDGQPLTVQGAAAQDDGTTVVLRTGIQRGGAVYNFTTHLGDLQGNSPRIDQDTFVGFGPAPDRVVPDAIAPTAGSVIIVPPAERADPHVTLAWSPRTGTIEYTIDVSATADFTTIDSTIIVPGSEARHELPVAEGTTYFWRVRSDATPPEEYGRSVFTVLFDTIYVFCPGGAQCRSGDGIGSKNVPLAAVSRAVTLANDRGLTTIAIASRGNDPTTGVIASYHEPVAITGDSITLRGGYEGTFTSPPDRRVNRSRIVYEGSVVTAVQNTGTIVIDKLELEAMLDAALPARTQTLSTFVADAPGAAITISDSFIGTAELPADSPPESLPEQATAVGVVYGTQPLVIDASSTILAGPAAEQSIAVFALSAGLQIDGAEIIARPTADNDGSTPIFLAAATAAVRRARIVGAGNQGGAINLLGSVNGVFEDNVIRLDDGAACTGAQLGVPAGAAVRFERNQIVVASRCDNGIGVVVSGPGTAIIANNIVLIDSQTLGVGMRAAQDSLALIVNNTFVITGTVGFGFLIASGFPDLVNNLAVFTGALASSCIMESGDFSDPKSLLNNVFVGCAQPYVNELGGDILASVDAVSGENIDCAGCGTTRASGNLVLPAMDPFVSLAGPDGILGTPDFDLNLAMAGTPLASGGHDTTIAECGSHESPHACGSVTTDAIGRARTPPVSVGAFEKD